MKWFKDNWPLVIIVLIVGIIGYLLGRNNSPDNSLYQYKYNQSQDSIKIVKYQIALLRYQTIS